MGLGDIEFFGVVDRQGRKMGGKIGSEFPAWFFDRKIEALEDEIASKKRTVERGFAAPEVLRRIEAEIKGDNEKLEQIRNSRPQITDKQKDELYSTWKELKGEIQDSLFNRSDMQKGLADPYNESKRMTEARIPIRGKIELMQNMGITVQDGKISRNQAARAWKIIGKLLGEPTNTEHLRKDHAYGTYHSEKRLEELL